MKGQWHGKFKGTSSGIIIVNVDELKDSFQGIIYLINSNRAMPDIAVRFLAGSKNNNFQLITRNISPINPLNQVAGFWDDFAKQYPTVTLESEFRIIGVWHLGLLSLTWKTDLGNVGSCKLKATHGSSTSILKAKKMSWDGFKKHIAALEGRRYLFRGQKEPWSLRTSFHRAGRADVQRFVEEDIQALNKHLSSRTKHIFNLDIPNENGAFFNLVQHHGYPTPLLDWTYSPYVAAYFAYRNITKKDLEEVDKTTRVRIFSFDQTHWKMDFEQYLFLATARLHLSVSEFMAIENERMIPQQSISTVTNIENIEAYVKSQEKVKGKIYLQAFDLPVIERDKVIQELRYMGITAGSMFPGLDGACEEIKDRNFDI